MADVRSTLDRVWKELRQASIVDDLLIIEYIAALLVEMAENDTPWPFNEQLRPQKQKIRYKVDDQRLKTWLVTAALAITSKETSSIQDLANLFDPHILFFPSYNSGKESYPTPRHIVAFMLYIAQIDPDNIFADFACGRGSFLINNNIKDNKFHPLGIDISANWIRISAANAFLHGRTNIELRQDDSFLYFQSRKANKFQKRTNTFTRIVMSPPTEGYIRLNPLPGQYQEKSASIAFTELLLDHLSASGRGVTIVSSAFVGETKPVDNSIELRERLVEKQLLRAVIMQQNGLFLTREPVHILSISQGQDHHTDFTWFCQIERDGYPIEGQRDFTEDADTAPEQNDIPFLQQVLQKKWKAGDFDYQDNRVRIELISWQNVLRGVVIQSNDGTINHITRNHLLPQKLIVHIQYTESDIKLLSIDFRLHTVELGSDVVLNAETDEVLFSKSKPDQLIAISVDGRLLGVTQTQEQIRTHDYNLSPQYYLDYYQDYDSRKRDDTEQPAAPIQQKSRPESFIPPEPIHQTLPETSQYDTILPRMFNAEQYAVWEAIKRYPRYFTQQHIRQITEQTDVTSTLNLLEKMGLIQQVSLATGTRDTATVIDTVYRRLSTDEISVSGTSNEEQPQSQA